MKKLLPIIAVIILVSACAGPRIIRVQPLSEDADAPYENVLVIALFESFDSRRYLEDDIVKQLRNHGITATASTSRMDTRTPVTRQTFLDMVEALESDAVLVTRLVSLGTAAKVKDARPQSTYIVRPTDFYNVWSVELTEYVGPQDLELKHKLVLATQLYSVKTHEPVWAIESTTKLTRNYQNRGDVSFIAAEAKAITRYLSRDGLLAP